MTAATIIREHRRRLRLGQAEAARRAGISAGYWGHVEAGDRRPSPAARRRIAAALNIGPETLQ